MVKTFHSQTFTSQKTLIQILSVRNPRSKPTNETPSSGNPRSANSQWEYKFAWLQQYSIPPFLTTAQLSRSNGTT
jgi:hypothetical protein